jgi:hypothetical protein
MLAGESSKGRIGAAPTEMKEPFAVTERTPVRVWKEAFDPIAIASVTVAIRGPNGALLESGEATSEHGVWIYRATVDAPITGRLQVEISARNRAGAEGRQIVEVRAA